jgi:Uma2 family endonuclease
MVSIRGVDSRHESAAPVSRRLARQIGNFAAAHDLGEVFAQDTGFQIHRAPDTVRAPDVAFVARARLEGIPAEGYAALAPDLVAEILSPGDRPGEVLEKVGQWLSAGARLVRVVDPPRRQAHVCRAGGLVTTVTAGDELDGEDVLPGFLCRVSDVV